jgi:GTP-binding protein HflX
MRLLSNARNCCLVSINEDTVEARELCRTLDIVVAEEVLQKKEAPDPHTFIGAGKLEELKELSDKVDVFVFDGELKPSQHFRLETSLKTVCTDRIGLILEIFERHAKSNEAKAQVDLAKIRHELPFLREWVSKGLSGDRPGFLAGGEYAIDAYYENARRQMKRIEGELERISAERKTRRDQRRERGFYLISICGYTNGGKSTLLSALSGAQTIIDDRLFSTLSTTTRLLSGAGKRVLVTDTVGFIRMLPPDLVDAFDATLEEIFESDCVILVLDLSDSIDVITDKLRTSLKILIPRTEKKKIIIAPNKIDRLSPDDLQRRINLIDEILFGYIYYLISAQTRIGIEELIKGILDKIGLTKTIGLSMPHDSDGQELYRWLTQRFVIVDSEWGERILLTMRITEEEEKTIKNRLQGHKNVLFLPESTDSS